MFIASRLDLEVPAWTRKEDRDRHAGTDVLGDTTRQAVFDRQHRIYALHGGDVLRSGDRVATGDDHGGIRELSDRTSDQFARRRRRLRGDRARVDHDDIRRRATGAYPTIGQSKKDLVTLGLVESAPERPEHASSSHELVRVLTSRAQTVPSTSYRYLIGEPRARRYPQGIPEPRVQGS
ncbi:hypothetical protein BMS3Bbin01_00690 [bacterium BMS3Bbin01]|nr:hypothetical protein BMS3Bbin01_00690 [bacterium BMS3Bbin01]